MLPTLTASVQLNIVYTILVIVGVIVFWIIEKLLVKKYEENMNKFLLLIVYFVLFSVLIVAFGGILVIWNFDLSTYFKEMSLDTLTFIESSIGHIISSLVVIFILLFILKVAKTSLNRVGLKSSANQRRKRTIAKLTLSTIRYLLSILSILIILAIWGVNVVPALAGLGIAGLVIGLGAQKFINDLISGFFIVFEHHYDVGDTIEAGGFRGEVTEIGLKTTKLKNFKGEVKIIANGDVTTLINHSKLPSLALVEFGIAYSEDLQKVFNILNEELPKLQSQMPEIIETPSVTGVVELSGSSINIRVTAKTLNLQHFGVERALRKRIKELLDDNHIKFGLPQVVVHKTE
ncbi:mechanosensitive ion channel family protein [Acholeplasma granularum]|uniref:mechanosensitive ion channel family protein n=1 Tax=Acholeplasma granularum TaxID=264635 RepID=UPI0004709775|nr:mechanosensitive ion channel family protein [Acholeplasma granularum]